MSCAVWCGARGASCDHPLDLRLQLPGILVARHLPSGHLLRRIYDSLVPPIALLRA